MSVKGWGDALLSRPARRLACLLCVAVCTGCGLIDAPKVEKRGKTKQGATWQEPPQEIPVTPGGQVNTPPAAYETDPPQASLNYVYVASPSSDAVEVIDARDLSIQTVQTGDQPSYLTTIPTIDDAIVINVGSEDASLIHIDPTNHQASHANFDIIDGANSIAVAPDGHHAVVFFDAAKFMSGDQFGDFQSVSVLSIDGAHVESRSITVGFKPERVFFKSDGSIGYLLTDSAISVLDFASIDAGGHGIAPTLSFGITVDKSDLTIRGKYAVARLPYSSELRLLDLESGTVQSFDATGLGTGAIGTITDLDVSEQGDLVLIAVPSFKALIEVPIPAGFGDATQAVRRDMSTLVPNTCKLVPHTTLALGYTPRGAVMQVVDFALPQEQAVQTLSLRKGVRDVQVTPDGLSVLILHDKLPGDPSAAGLDIETRIQRSYGYSLLKPASSDLRLTLTDFEIAQVAIVPDSSYLFMTFADNGLHKYNVERVALASFTAGPPIRLDSPATAIGTIVGRGKVFVSQDHPDGRLTLVEWTTAHIETVTGYALNSEIRD